LVSKKQSPACQDDDAHANSVHQDTNTVTPQVDRHPTTSKWMWRGQSRLGLGSRFTRALGGQRSAEVEASATWPVQRRNQRLLHDAEVSSAAERIRTARTTITATVDRRAGTNSSISRSATSLLRASTLREVYLASSFPAFQPAGSSKAYLNREHEHDPGSVSINGFQNCEVAGAGVTITAENSSVSL